METYQGNTNKTIKNIGKGIGIALLTTMILLLIFSLILTYTNVSESTIEPVIIVITAISILLRKFYWKWKYQKKWNFEWRHHRWQLYTYFIYYFEYSKLEIWVEFTKRHYDSGWDYIWNTRRYYRS